MVLVVVVLIWKSLLFAALYCFWRRVWLYNTVKDGVMTFINWLTYIFDFDKIGVIHDRECRAKATEFM